MPRLRDGPPPGDAVPRRRESERTANRSVLAKNPCPSAPRAYLPPSVVVRPPGGDPIQGRGGELTAGLRAAGEPAGPAAVGDNLTMRKRAPADSGESGQRATVSSRLVSGPRARSSTAQVGYRDMPDLSFEEFRGRGDRGQHATHRAEEELQGIRGVGMRHARRVATLPEELLGEAGESAGFAEGVEIPMGVLPLEADTPREAGEGDSSKRRRGDQAAVQAGHWERACGENRAGRDQGRDQVAALMAREGEGNEAEDQARRRREPLPVAGRGSWFRSAPGDDEASDHQETPGSETTEEVGGGQHRTLVRAPPRPRRPHD